MVEWRKSGGVEREMLQLWGNKTTQQHLTCGWGGGGGGGGRQGSRAAHSGIVIRGGGMQLIRFGEMDHSLKSSPWKVLTQNSAVTV